MHIFINGKSFHPVEGREYGSALLIYGNTACQIDDTGIFKFQAELCQPPGFYGHIRIYKRDDRSLRIRDTPVAGGIRALLVPFYQAFKIGDDIIKLIDHLGGSVR